MDQAKTIGGDGMRFTVDQGGTAIMPDLQAKRA
jgi:hypothetical protein